MSAKYYYYGCWVGLIAIALGAITTQITKAQTIPPTQLPDPIIPTPSPSPAPLPLPNSEPTLQSPPTTPTPTEQFPPGETIVVEKFKFEGNTAISDEELNQEVGKLKLTNRRITFEELLQARSAVTQLYIDRGFKTSGAFIPPQTLHGGKGEVIIQIVEGRVEAIEVRGTRRLNPGYVRSRIALATGTPLNQNRLLEALRLLQLNPLIKNVSAELRSGSSLGTNLLVVTVDEANTFNVQFDLNNNRSPSVGTLRRQVQIGERNLLGLGDGLTLSYSNTDGSNEINANYTLPINSRNGTISFNYGFSKSNIIEEPFDQLDIAARSSTYEMTFRQPIIQTANDKVTQELAFGLTASRRESKTWLLNVPFALSPGADEDGRIRISALRFFQEWTSRRSREVFAARSQFSFGVGAFDATSNESAPDSNFLAWRGQVQWVRVLARDTLFLLSGDVQLSDRPLLALEQTALGGQETIRGYRQDVLLTDNSALASAEFRFPIYRMPRQQGLLQIIPFVDVGAGWNSGRVNPSSNTLVSTGVGLQWRMGDRLLTRLDWGIPLIEVDSRKRTWQENGFYFSIQYNPF